MGFILPPKEGTLYASTMALLTRDHRTTLELHKASGLPFYWLRAMREGRSKDPGVNKIQHLYEFLSGTKLL